MPVTMLCMTTKKKFDVEDPEVVMLSNNKYAYRCECPWEGKNGKKLTAFKFCTAAAFEDYQARHKASTSETEQETAE